MKCPYCEETLDHVVIKYLDSSGFRHRTNRGDVKARLTHGRVYLCPNCDKLLPVRQ